MDFKAWAAASKLNAATVEILVKEELDCFETLKNITDEDLKALNLTTGQLIALRKAIADMKDGTHSIQQEIDFQSWAAAKKLNTATVEKLEKEDLNCFETLKNITDEDIKALNLTTGQLIVLRQAIVELKDESYSKQNEQQPDPTENLQNSDVATEDTSAIKSEPSPRQTNCMPHRSTITTNVSPPKPDAFRSWLEQRMVKSETIDKMYALDFDSRGTMILMTEDDISKMELTPGQTRVLVTLIDEERAQEKGKQATKIDKAAESSPVSEKQQLALTQSKSHPDCAPAAFVSGPPPPYTPPSEAYRSMLLSTDGGSLNNNNTQRPLASLSAGEPNTEYPPMTIRNTNQDLFAAQPNVGSSGASSLSQNMRMATTDFSATNPEQPLDSMQSYSDDIRYRQGYVGRMQQHFHTTRIPAHEYPGKSASNRNNQREDTPPVGAVASTKSQGKSLGARIVQKVSSGWDKVTNFLTSQGSSSHDLEVCDINGMKIVKLPLKKKNEDKQEKIRRCIIGNHSVKQLQKTIMMVGSTGSGKSTLIDGFCNYIFDAKWEETSRFKLIDEHDDEKKNAAKGQSQSQTEWITVYTITCGESNRLPYTLNLIDTPGFGDTRGIKRDQELVKQIRALFGNPKKYGIDSLDAVCFLAKAPDARLTHTQRYIFDSILSIFGNDIKDNILVMVTFADGAESPVLEAIKAAGLPHRKTFKFNNSALFANNGQKREEDNDSDNSDQEEQTTSFSQMFWTMGEASFKAFFQFLKKLQTRSLNLTKEVLDQRFSLQETLKVLEQRVHKGLATMSRLKKEKQILQDNEQKIRDNEDFEYTVTEVVTEKVDCQLNHHVTHCMNCHETCHDNCSYKNDDEKMNCIAMDSKGNCQHCKQKCIWSDHTNSGFYLESKEKEVKKTYSEMKQEYEKATGMVQNAMSVIELVEAEYSQLQYDVEKDVKRCRGILQRLNEIALKPDPLSEVDYIDMLIEAEKSDSKQGWQERVAELRNIRSRAERLSKIVTGGQVLQDPSFV